MSAQEFSISLSASGSYDLDSKGNADQAKHQKRIKQAIKENLGNIISQENIITSDGKKIVKIPIRTIELPRFRFDPNNPKGIGAGEGGTKVGDVIGSTDETGQGRKAGNQPGIDYYEVGITIDELAPIIFEEMSLPDLLDKTNSNIEHQTIEFNEIRRVGSMANLAKRRTIMANLRRNAMETGVAFFGDISDDDLRFRTWDDVARFDTSAVVIAMRDVSGSMGEFEKYITRSFYFWMVRFLRTKYQNVEMVFITHHTEAKEVDEEAFFSLGEGGGTRVSSAYQLSLDVINQRYHEEDWNIYPFHASDGDNWGDTDNALSAELVRKHFSVGANMFGYLEIVEGNKGWSSRLMSTINSINDPRVRKALVNDRKDVYPALKTFFTKGDKAVA